MQSQFAVVINLPGALPDTLPSMLGKDLSGAVLTGDFLVLPLDSNLCLSSGEKFAGTPEFISLLISLGGGSFKITEWTGSLRDLYATLYGAAL